MLELSATPVWHAKQTKTRKISPHMIKNPQNYHTGNPEISLSTFIYTKAKRDASEKSN